MAEPNNVKSIFSAASEKPLAERAGYLDEAAGSDTALRARVEALLKAHDNPDSFLKEAAAEFGATIDLSPAEHPLAERPGTLIGPYKLLEQIGEGGMGVVYMAEQQEPVRRRVALKIIKAGMDTRQMIARFEAERQALALMDHSNIARVLDAGATETGRPYFVMELVRGIPITEYCDQNNLSVHERLELFVQVCHAVQHAHQKGIIHRDLKPSNVLVTVNDGQAVPKVIDFGVAKATGQRLTEKTLFTAFAQMVGTPLYMSPEQAEMTSVDIDTRSDIYSLGVLLYELLTGTTPFDQERMRAAAFDEIRRIIREEEPPKPSTRISTLGESRTATAAHRQVDSHRLGKLVEGDLDWIVMKALEKDRTRRYDTAGNFAADVLRHLSDEPVDACPPSATYRFRKFARRNRVALVTLSLVAGALVLGTVISAWQAIRATQAAHLTELARAAEAKQRAEAEEQRKHAEANEKKAQTEATKSKQVAKFLADMLEGAGPAVARGRDATLLREILSTTSVRIEKELTEQPQVQGDLWYTLGETYSQIQDAQQGISMLKHAVDSYRAAFDKPHTKLALALCHLGRNQSMTGDIVSGNSNAQLGLEMARESKDPLILAECLYYRILAFEPYGQRPPAEAIPLLREAISLWKQDGQHPNNLATCMVWLAITLYDTEEAELLAREALALARQSLPENHPDISAEMNNLSGILLRRGKFEEAEVLLRETVGQSEKLYGEQTRPLEINRRRLVEALAQGGKWDEAEAVVRKGLEVETRSPTNNYYHNYAVMLVRLQAAQGQLDEALAESERFISAYPLDGTLKQTQAVLLLQTGRLDDYRHVCHALLAKGHLPSEVAAARLALLLPVSDPDLVRAYDFVDLAVSSSTLPTFGIGDINNSRLTKALADYRRERFQSAFEWANRALSSDRLEKYKRSEAYIIQAMALAAQKQPESARAALASADSLLREPHANFASGSEGGIYEWAVVEHLRREAADVMAGRPPITRPEEQLQVAETADRFRERGNAHAAAERWNEAVADLSRAVELDPNDEQASLRLAVALLKNAKEAEYRRHCHTCLERIVESQSFFSADKAAKASLLLPVDGADFERACKLADFAATATEPSHLLHWLYMGKALAEYRRARFDSANGWADRCLSADSVAPECQAAALFIQAAVGARLEQPEAARAALAKGEELAKQPRPSANSSWLDWAIADILRREAAKLLGISEPATSTDAVTQQ
jgi:serine/threonine protein kinase/tetratricopeptide (TPR) repeat protein